MDKPLTFLSSICVLEYLEANKRIHICKRNPDLQKMEQKIPLHLDSLIIGYPSITLNDITYQLYSRKNGEEREFENVPYVDYRQTESTANFRPNSSIHLKFKKDQKQYEFNHRVPEHLSFHVAMKRLTRVLLGTRNEIFVKRFEVVDDWKLENLKVLLGLQLSIQELKVDSDYLKYLISLLDCKSIKSLKIEFCRWNDPCFELPLVQSVQKLYIDGVGKNGNAWNETLLKLPNRDITLDCLHLTRNEIEDFIKGLVNEGGKVGTCYTMKNQPCSLEIFEDIGQQFGVEVIKKIDSDRNNTSFLLCIPMGAKSKLQICGNDEKHAGCINIEVAPIIPEEERPDGC